MKIQLILTAYIVNFGLTSVQASNQRREQFGNLFDSISRNDAKKSDAYQKILEQEVAKEQEIFDNMKEEIQMAQNRNSHRKRNFYKKSDLSPNIVAAKRQVKVYNTPEPDWDDGPDWGDGARSIHVSKINRQQQSDSLAVNHVIEIRNNEHFHEELRRASPKRLVVVFIADFLNGDSRQMVPSYRDLPFEYLDVTFLKVDVQYCTDVPEADLNDIPTFLFYRDQTQFHTYVGSMMCDLEEKIQRFR